MAEYNSSRQIRGAAGDPENKLGADSIEENIVFSAEILTSGHWPYQEA